jgi:hypothetical protein
MPRKSGNGHSVEFADRKVNVKTFEHSVEVELKDKELLALGDEISTLDAERRPSRTATAMRKRNTKRT